MTDCKKWKTALSLGNFTTEVFDKLKSCGIEYIEVSPHRDIIDTVDFDMIQRESERTGVKVWSFHLPFGGKKYDISHIDEKIRAFTIEADKHYIKTAHSLGAKVAVIHPSGEPIEQSKRQLYMECCKKSLKELADYAESLGIVLAVEDLPRTCLGRDTKEMIELVECDSRLRVCFDVNHLLCDSHEQFICELGDKIVTLHISDYDFVDEMHAMPGCALIDWHKLITLLEKADYNGPFLYEVALAGRDLRGFVSPKTSFQDVVENHYNIKTFTGASKKL